MIVFIVMQLLYEFSKSFSGDRDVVTDVVKNWNKVCKSLLSSSEEEELTFADERCALQVNEKNIYHKKPSKS